MGQKARNPFRGHIVGSPESENPLQERGSRKRLMGHRIDDARYRGLHLITVRSGTEEVPARPTGRE